MVICLERDADLHMAQLMPLPLTVHNPNGTSTDSTVFVRSTVRYNRDTHTHTHGADRTTRSTKVVGNISSLVFQGPRRGIGRGGQDSSQEIAIDPHSLDNIHCNSRGRLQPCTTLSTHPTSSSDPRIATTWYSAVVVS